MPEPPAATGAVGDLMRERRKALRAVKANLDLKASDAAAKYSPNAALYKKRRALRNELNASAAASTAASAARRAADADAGPGSGRKEKRKKFFSSLLDSPAKPRTAAAAAADAAAAEEPAAANDSPQERKRVHGVLQSPAEIRLSEAGKKARRQLTKLSKLTGLTEGAERDEPVFTKRSQMFEPMDGAIFCSDLAPGLSEAAAANGTTAVEVQSVERNAAAVNVAAQFGRTLVAGAIAAAAKEITML